MCVGGFCVFFFMEPSASNQKCVYSASLNSGCLHLFQILRITAVSACLVKNYLLWKLLTNILYQLCGMMSVLLLY